MDLLDFGAEQLYFEETIHPQAEQWLKEAAQNYGEEVAEVLLLRSFFYEPDNLTVLVALYRFFFYQHRYEDALQVARRALLLTGQRMGFPSDWQALKESDLQDKPMTLIRFYLMALKGAGYLHLRVGQLDIGRAMLDKVIELDPVDRLGATVLKNVLIESEMLASNE